MKESDIQSLFTKWLKTNGFTGCFELKIVKNNKRFYFSQIEDNQLYGLSKAKHSRLTYKLSDIFRDTKPFDCFCLAGVLAYIAICFYHQRRTKRLLLIDIDIIQMLIDKQKKSLTEEEAESFSDQIITL